MTIKTTLPTDSATRKRYPLLRGALNYAPAAIAGMARVSINGNDKHNPGEELHHARGKSMDHGDCILRHLMDVQDILAAIKRGEDPDTDQAARKQLREEVDQLMWRAALFSQEIHEKYLGAPLAPGARLPAAEPATCGWHLDWPGGRCLQPAGHAGEHGARDPVRVGEPKPDTVTQVCGEGFPRIGLPCIEKPGHYSPHRTVEGFIW